MSDIELKDVLDSPEAGIEGEDTPKEPSPEPTKEPEIKKEDVIEKPPVPYDRFKEVNDELKTVRSEIQDLRSKGKEDGLSEEEKSELKAKEYIERTAREAYQKMLAEDASEEAEREHSIGEEIKFYNSIDKDFNAKVAEEIGNKYGTEKNPIPVEIAYNIFQNEKQLKSQIQTPKPKVPNPIRSTDSLEIPEDKESQGKSFWQVVEEAKKTLTGK